MPDGNLKLNLAIFGLGAVPALRAVRRAIQAVTDAAGEQQRALAAVARRIEGLGDATELSTPSLARMASELQDITTFGDEAVLEMQAILLTFRELGGVGEAEFRRVTETVLDMAAAMGIDAPGAARQLALALEDPEAGLRRLRDSGATFNEQQRETIEGLVETGRRAEALGAVLDVLEGQAGGSARALRDTLPGALDALSNAWGDLLEQSVGTGRLREEIDRLTGALGDPDSVRAARELGAALTSSATYLVENADVLVAVAGALAGAKIGSRFGPYGALGGAAVGGGALYGLESLTPLTDEKLSAKIAGLQTELHYLRQSQSRYEPNSVLGRENLPGIEADIAQNEAMIAALQSRLFARIPDEQPGTSFRIGAAAPLAPGAVRDPAEARRELRDRIDAEREAEREAAEAVAAIHARAEDRLAELTLDRIALVHREEGKWLRELARLRQESPALEKEMAEAKITVQRAALAEVARINREADEEDRRRYEQAAEERARAEKEAARRAIERGREIAEAAERARREALGPLGRGLEDYARDALDAAEEIQLATEQAFAGMEGALVDFVRTGEFEFRRFADFVIAELARIAVQRAITGPLSAALGGLPGLGGGAFRGVSEAGGHLFFHAGGVAGAPGGSVRHGVDPRAFAGAPRFPHGGLASDEVPAILRRGEGVFTPEQMRALGGPPSLEVRLVNEGGRPQGGRRRRRPLGRREVHRHRAAPRRPGERPGDPGLPPRHVGAAMTWPAYANVAADGYGLGQDDDVARTRFDDGAVRQGRRHTRALDLRRVRGWLASDEDLVRFRAWARESAHAWFDWRDTEDGVTRRVRVRGGAGAIRYTARVRGGRRTWDFELELEGFH